MRTDKLKAVLFDVDGVLLDSTAANAAFYRELFRRIGEVVPTDEELATYNHVSVEAMIRKYYPQVTDEQTSSWAAMADFIGAGFELLQPMPGAVDVVPLLAAKYKLGLVTNRRLSGVEELWQVVPTWQQYFSAIASYDKTENHKPHPEPVQYALKELRKEPDQAVFIGDAKTDLQAGQAAGVDVIILGQEHWDGAAATIASFNELPMAIQRLV